MMIMQGVHLHMCSSVRQTGVAVYVGQHRDVAMMATIRGESRICGYAGRAVELRRLSSAKWKHTQ